MPRYHGGRNGGHAPGHVRDTFLEAVEAFIGWNGVGPEPTVQFEVNYEPRQVTLSEACGLVWNCTDVLPGSECSRLQDELNVKTSGSYAAAAHALRRWLAEREAKAA
jgi:hypothetical protein